MMFLARLRRTLKGESGAVSGHTSYGQDAPESAVSVIANCHTDSFQPGLESLVQTELDKKAAQG